MFNLLTVNPAFAGSSEMVNLQAISRQQWMGLEGNPKTTVFDADAAMSIRGVESGVGIHFLNDQLGFLNNSLIALSGSAKLRLEQATLSGGVSISFMNQVLDPKSWLAGSQSSESASSAIAATKLNGNLVDMGLGVFYKTPLMYGGFSIQHLFNPVPRYDKEGFYYLKRCYYLTGGIKHELLDKPIVLMPSVFIKSDAVSIQADFNCNAVYKKRYMGGLSYRMQDALVILGGIETKSGLKICYSYDIPISRFSRNFGGSHEMSVGYTFKLNVDKKVKKYKSVRYL